MLIMAAMKATLEKLVKENKQKEAHIKRQKKKIARATRKLEKQQAQSFIKSSESEEEEKTSVQSEALDKKVH